MDKNKDWFYFNQNLLGYDCYYRGKFVPRFVLFWMGYSSQKIKYGLTDIKLRPKT